MTLYWRDTIIPQSRLARLLIRLAMMIDGIRWNYHRANFEDDK